jgi:predicted nucleic acid-binding protein
VIVVDTSVWVAALRGTSPDVTRTLQELLDADEVVLPLPVRVELAAGISRQDRVPLRRALSALPIVAPCDETWDLIEEWVERAAIGGHRFSVPDLLIGAMAEELGALVWSLDSDFEQMEEAGLVQRYRP